MGLNVELLRGSFEAVTPMGDKLTARFYELLFERYPQVKPMFANLSMEEQGKKLLASLALIVASLEDGEKLTSYLKELGARHVGYGTQDAHYDAVGECLLVALAETAGDLWNDDLQTAWTDAYAAIASLMTQGAAEAASN